MYSQQDEEKHILAACLTMPRSADDPSNWLLDIGAYHPTVFSNSRALIEHGWKAVLIEPSPGPVRALIQEYGRGPHVVINAAVGLEAGLIEIMVTDDAVSSSDPKVQNLWKDTGGYLGHALFPAITLGDIFNRFGGAFDFINIDTEGTSVDLLRELIRIGPRPHCICVEHDGRTIEVAQIVGDEYRVEHLNDTNIILVKR